MLNGMGWDGIQMLLTRVEKKGTRTRGVWFKRHGGGFFSQRAKSTEEPGLDWLLERSD